MAFHRLRGLLQNPSIEEKPFTQLPRNRGYTQIVMCNKATCLILLMFSLFSLSCKTAQEKITEQARYLNESAVYALLRGQPDSALAFYKKAFDLDSSNVMITRNYSVELLNHKRIDDALKVLMIGYRNSPQSLDLSISIGSIFAARGDTASSRPFFISALAVLSDRVAAKDTCTTRTDRAFIYYLLGDTLKAKMDVAQAELTPCDDLVLSLLKDFDSNNWLQGFR